MLPWAHLCPNPKWHLHQFSRYCTAHGRESLDFTMGWAFFPLKLPFPIGGSELPSDTWFLGQLESLTQTVCRLVQPFCTAYPYALQWAALSFLKIASFHWGSGPNQYVIPWAHLSPQCKWHLRWFIRFCTAHHRVLHFTIGHPFPLTIAPSHGVSGPHLIHGSLCPPKSSTQTSSWSVELSLQGSLLWQTDR